MAMGSVRTGARLQDWIIDGRPGGLIVGRGNDNIWTLRDTPEGYVSYTRAQGGEFLTSTSAFINHQYRFTEINNVRGDHVQEISIKVDRFTRVINTHAEPDDKLILIEPGQFVVNAFATSLFYEELASLNRNIITGCNWRTQGQDSE